MNDEIKDFVSESRFVLVVAWLSLGISLLNFIVIYELMRGVAVKVP